MLDFLQGDTKNSPGYMRAHNTSDLFVAHTSAANTHSGSVYVLWKFK